MFFDFHLVKQELEGSKAFRHESYVHVFPKDKIDSHLRLGRTRTILKTLIMRIMLCKVIILVWSWWSKL
jgi:hypothetical protein